MNSRVLSAVIAVAATASVLAGLAAVGCGGSRPATPEAVFEKVAEYNLAGETGKIWDLYAPDQREKMMKDIDSARVTLRANPGLRGLTAQFKCTPEEFERLSYVELLHRENQGNERTLVGAKVVDKQPDPRRPDETMLTIQLVGGARQIMRVRKLDGGYALVEIRHLSQ